MKNDHVMAKEVELEALHEWHDVIDVVVDLDYAEREHEARVLRVKVDEVMVTAFIHIDDVVAAPHVS